MKVVSWNVNGLRAVLKSSGRSKTLKEVLDGLGGDIICLQETKATRVSTSYGHQVFFHDEYHFLACIPVQVISWTSPCTWWMVTMHTSPSARPRRDTLVHESLHD